MLMYVYIHVACLESLLDECFVGEQEYMRATLHVCICEQYQSLYVFLSLDQSGGHCPDCSHGSAGWWA